MKSERARSWRSIWCSLRTPRAPAGWWARSRHSCSTGRQPARRPTSRRWSSIRRAFGCGWCAMGPPRTSRSWSQTVWRPWALRWWARFSNQAVTQRGTPGYPDLPQCGTNLRDHCSGDVPMNRFPKPLRLTLWCLLAMLQLACVPQPAPTPLPTFTPTATPSATPLGPTATLFPSATPARTPTPTHTPVVPVAFRSIQMIDNRTGWAVADVGRGATTRILRTEDGGLSWRDRSPLDGDFFHGYFLDGSTAWAWTTWGGLAFRTPDGGRSWEEVGSMAVDPYTGFVDSQPCWLST